MLRDKIISTAVGLLALGLLILIARGMDQLLPIEVLQVTRPATVVAMCVIIVLMVRPWIPRRKH